MPDVDVAILGGGCAGLSLAARLASTKISFRIIEPRREYDDDRTWSFWRTGHDPFEDCVRASWTRWTVSGPGGDVLRGSRRFPYQSVASDAFYGRALDLIDDACSGSIALGLSAGSVRAKGDAMWIETSDGGFSARHVCDARPPERRPAYGQFFLGREIVTAQAVFDPDIVPLMHFRHGYSTGIDFLYVLPFARDRALMEVTSFAREAPKREDMRAWLDEEIINLGACDHDVVREESGALPMEVGYRAKEVPGICHIGLAGGAARPSTGYAFQRIQMHADHILVQLLRGEQPRIPHDSVVSSFMDRVFLRVLAAKPERGPLLFETLFRNTPADRLERFLSGSTRSDDRLSVMWALPSMPFLRAASGLA